MARVGSALWGIGKRGADMITRLTASIKVFEDANHA